MKAIILAAGRGERMRPLTDTTPKALLQVGGRALIEYHIAALAAAGIRELVVNLAWLGDQVAAYLGDGGRYGVSICYSNEGSSALETGGGIFRALPLLGDQPFWVVNGDIHTRYSFDLSGLHSGALGHLVLIPNPAHNPDGDFALADGRVRNSGDSTYTYSGIGLFDPALFAGESDGVFPLAPLLRAAADDGRLNGELYTGMWADIGTPERLATAASLYSG
jgi:MurNAc alpha-1-phosphate uridylyltransferase